MTTDVRVNLIENVFKKNNVFNLKKIKGLEKVAAVSLLMKKKDHNRNVYSKVSEYLYQKILINLPNYNIWIFSAFVIPYSKIIEYKLKKNFWQVLYGFKIESKNVENFIKIIKNEEEIRVFHIVNISNNKNMRDFLTTKIFSEMTHSKYIVVLPKESNLKEAINIDWFGYNLFDNNLLKYIVSNKGIIFRDIGWFDDMEIGFIGIGDKNAIYQCCKEVKQGSVVRIK